MKPQLRWPVFVLAVLSAILVFSQGIGAAEGHFERTLKVTGPVELDVLTGAGSITVRTGEASSVQVKGTIKAWGGSFGSNDEAGKKVRYLESNPPIEQHVNIIKIGHIEDRRLERNVSISYGLVVPVETRLRAATGSGDQAIDGIAGPLDTSTGSGTIKASNIGGEVRASAGSGNIGLDRVRGNVRASAGSGDIRAAGIAGGLKASTGSGDVTFEQTALGDVEVTTGSGEVGLKNVQGALRAHSASGDITAEGKASGSWRLETASGNVTVRLPSQAGFNLHARTVSGGISTDRPLSVQGTVSRRELSGKVGEGGFLLDVNTVSGDIRIE